MVRYITYKDNKYPVRLGVEVLKAMKSDAEYLLDDDLDQNRMESMIWHGLISGHKHEKKELTLKIEDVEEVLEECFLNFLELIFQSYSKQELERFFPGDFPDYPEKKLKQ